MTEESESFHIVVKLVPVSETELVRTDEIGVAEHTEEAVERVGARHGDVFAVWSVPEQPSPAAAAAHVASVPAYQVEVFLNGTLFMLEHDYRKVVRQGGRG